MMAIKTMKVENFTVFKNMEVEFSPGINVFIGENGTGKTHLLKLLYVANAMHIASGYTIDIRDVFGNNFKSNGCRFVIDGDDSHPWTLSGISTPTGTKLNPPHSYIHVDFENKAPAVFIPAKEVLSLSNITRVADEYKRTLNIDITITDIIDKARKLVPDVVSDFAIEITKTLENQIGGKTFFDEKDGTFWIQKANNINIPFTSEAEGYKKLGLLWQLIMNKSITENTVLLWDEPEANLSRLHTSALVDMLIELSRHGVQVFIATHDYNLMKYFSIKKKNSDQVAFISLYKGDEGIVCEYEDDYDLLKHNAIIDADIKLLEDEIEEG